MNKKALKIFIFVLVFLVFLIMLKYSGLDSYLTLDSLKQNQTKIQELYSHSPLRIVLVFSLIYIISVAISFPGASILSLAGGGLFGFWNGLIIVSLSSTIGATIAFLVSRFLFKDFLQNRFNEKFIKINAGMKEKGNMYLFTLRLIPVIPFFLINILMGLTSIKIISYFWISLLGMLPGTVIYINAGTELAKIQSTKDIFSVPILISLTLLGIFPMIISKLFNRTKKFDYNMIVIGGGSAGLVTSYIGAVVKAKVLLIEKHKMGGDCLNTGCVPSKALIKSAKVAHLLKRSAEFGIKTDKQEIDFSIVMNRIQIIIKEIEPHDSIDRYNKLGVECLHGNAFINSPNEVEVNGQIFTTKNIVIATGASPVVPNLPNLLEVDYLTSENLWYMKELPKRLIVLGGGPIGCEISQSFARLGSSVTQIEMSEFILNREDVDVSAFIENRFKSEGVTVLTNHKAISVDSKSKILICEHQNERVEIEFDQIFLALGRKANVKGFGLEKMNIEISDRGTIVADKYLRTTNYKNIFVCGDVTGPYQFTHTASHQAWYVAVNALFGIFKKFKVDYRVIPWCTFTDPEVARVGLNEKEAKEKGIDYLISKFDLNELDRAITDSEKHGFIKVLTQPNSDKILGVTIVGDHAGDYIGEYVTAMKYNLGLNKILGTIHIYPTFAESNKYVAGVWKKQNAPLGLLTIIEKWHAFRR